MKNQNEIGHYVTCNNCKEKINFTSDSDFELIKHKVEFEVEGQSIFLTYFDCPSCGRRHFVQVDDEKSIKELEEVFKQYFKFAGAKRKNKKFPKKQLHKYEASRKHLERYRENLKKQFAGKKIKEKETGLEFILEYTYA